MDENMLVPEFPQSRIEEILELIPTFEEERQVLRPGLDQDHTYFFEIPGQGNKRLNYFGSNHSYDPTNSQYPRLESTRAEFIRAAVNPIFVLESESSYIDETVSDDLLIQHSCELGYMTAFCKRSGLKFICYEMNEKEKIETLLKGGFSPQSIRLFFFAQLYNQIAKIEQYRDGIPGFINGSLKGLVESGVLSLQEPKDLYTPLAQEFEELEDIKLEKIPGHDLLIKLEKHAYPTDMNPCGYLSKARDARVIIGTEHLWNSGYSPFIVYGSSHALRQERALRKFLVN